MSKLKKCGKCGNQYGLDKGFLYACEHHPITSKTYPMPQDMLNVRGVIECKTMTKAEFISKYVV